MTTTNDAPAPAPSFPDDATPEMVAAALKVDWANEDEEGVVHNVWHAMVAAAPMTTTNDAPAPAPSGGGVREIIETTLRDYRLSNMRDDIGGAYPLVDLMSNDGQSIATGEAEIAILADEIAASLASDAGPRGESLAAKFKIGDRVTKTKGSSWTGRVVGTYSTVLTPEGYAVESETETGSVQVYPAAALALASETEGSHGR